MGGTELGSSHSDMVIHFRDWLCLRRLSLTLLGNGYCQIDSHLVRRLGHAMLTDLIIPAVSYFVRLNRDGISHIICLAGDCT
jgi:hypothetical protein